ncbi:MAG TPA: FliH/SctL family protein [Gemmatimonadales bacterium]|nr:FliH/SctL family protein [Gemmatimonadales bacterium]
MPSFERWAMPDIMREPVAEVLPPESPGPTPEDEAYARGYAEGYQAGVAEGEAKVRSACHALAGATQALHAVEAAYASEMEQTLTTLALAIARQIVQREVALDGSVIQDLVRRAAESVPAETSLEIRLHPADLAVFGTEPELYGAGGRKLQVRWLGDPTLERGSYVIETPQRVIDGELDAVLKIIYERLRDV